MTVVLVGLLAFTGCKKESNSPLNNVVHFLASDFQGEAANTSAARNSVPASNMKIAIRKVASGDNTYRLALRIDSMLITEGSNSKMIPLPDNAKIVAGLSVPNFEDPTADIVIFAKNTLTFKKETENGFNLFVSDPFITDFDFDYELVEIQYAIEVPNMVITLAESHYLILPNGKSVLQNPEVEKVNGVVSSNGELKKLDVTISGDPAQEVEKLKFVPEPFLKDPKDPKSIVQLPTVLLTKSHFNQNSGIAKFKIDGTYAWTTSHDVKGKFYGIGKGGGFTPILQPDATIYE